MYCQICITSPLRSVFWKSTIAPQMRIHLLIDLSGTLHIGDAACPGAIAALEKLRRARPVSPTSTVHLRFCSEWREWERELVLSACTLNLARNESTGNTTKESTSDLQQRLSRAGFDEKLIPKESILTSLEASKKLIRHKAWRPLLLLTPSAQSTFKEDGKIDAFFARSDSPPSKLAAGDKRLLEQCDSVLLGLAPDLFTSEWMDEAFRILSSEYDDSRRSEKYLIAAHRALYYRPATSAPLSLGPGAYIAALEAATQRSAADTIVCGKPSRTFYESCLNSMREVRQGEGPGKEEQQEEERNIVIGDDIDADLGGAAVEMDLERILVKTGKYRQGDEDRTSTPVQVFSSFAEFVERELFDKGIVQL